MFRKPVAVAVLLVVGAALSVPAMAGKSATIEVTKPTSAGTVKITFKGGPPGYNNIYDPVEVDIDGTETAEQKRDKILDALDDSFDAEAVGNFKIKVSGLSNKVKRVKLEPGRTGEDKDSVKTEKVACAMAAFEGMFEPFDMLGDPAEFSAGFATDIGGLEATVTAEELGFDTSGEMIAWALFEELMPQAPAYGVEVMLEGPMLRFHFFEGMTEMQGKVIFGTSSPSEGCWGSIDYIWTGIDPVRVVAPSDGEAAEGMGVEPAMPTP